MMKVFASGGSLRGDGSGTVATGYNEVAVRRAQARGAANQNAAVVGRIQAAGRGQANQARRGR